MKQVKVNIRGIVATQRYGTLETGDILTTDEAFAKHLVEECGAGEYVAEKATVAADQPAKPKSKKPAAAKAPVAEEVTAAKATEETAAQVDQGDSPHPSPAAAPASSVQSAGARPTPAASESDHQSPCAVANP